MLSVKIEDKWALANTEKTAAVPGIAFAEWGPGDMGLSLSSWRTTIHPTLRRWPRLEPA
jgi:2-keto-3-deoxy-L-rhamnonate aldolase RhmA